jgi:hypothetical protein
MKRSVIGEFSNNKGYSIYQIGQNYLIVLKIISQNIFKTI